jgi:hypothetical protein
MIYERIREMKFFIHKKRLFFQNEYKFVNKTLRNAGKVEICCKNAGNTVY